MTAGHGAARRPGDERAQRGDLARPSANGRTSARAPTIPANGSLVGAHRIAGNYSPEINFSLAQGQDFLAPIRDHLRTSRAASGAVPSPGRAVPNATGYFLMAVGSRSDNTIVMWSSSEIQFNQMGVVRLSLAEPRSRG